LAPHPKWHVRHASTGPGARLALSEGHVGRLVRAHGQYPRAGNWRSVLVCHWQNQGRVGMLVLLGPRFSGTDDELVILAAETGLALYDLRARLQPGAWSVVRVVADAATAEQTAARISARGLQSCALDSGVGRDPSRRIVYLRGIEVMSDYLVLRMVERAMKVPIGALLTIVRGDVHLGRTPLLSASTQGGSFSLRGTSGAANLSSSVPPPYDVFVAADLHFVTVPWLARIDPRDCEFGGYRRDDANAELLDRFIDDLGVAGQVRVDRHLKTSSLASHTVASVRPTAASQGAPPSMRCRAAASDEHFDAYSRMVGEAERRTFAQR
jgi:hypothetical protein